MAITRKPRICLTPHKQRYARDVARHIRLALVLMLLVLWMDSPVMAQQNGLQNPGFEAPYETRQVGVVLATGWQSWWATAPREADWMNIKPVFSPYEGEQVREGSSAQLLIGDNNTFTAALYQQVAVPQGAALRAEVALLLENSTESRSRARIGLGSGTNPLADTIIWSDWLTAHGAWQTLSVETTWQADSITLFVLAAQAAPNSTNRVYLDAASLTRTDGGSLPNSPQQASAPTNRPPATNPPTQQASADPVAAIQAASATPTPTQVTPTVPTATPTDPPPTATPQPPLMHTVVEGDTLFGIALTYGVSVDALRELNNLTSDIIQINQELLIRAGSTPVPTATPTPETSPTPTATATQAGPTQPPFTPVDPLTAPTAPVQPGAQADPLAQSTQFCISMYDDANQNRIADAGEGLLAGGLVQLQRGDGAIAFTYETTGVDEPHCVPDLAAGQYVVLAQAPAGYGLTTPRRLQLAVQGGIRFQVGVGAAQNVPTPAPTNAEDTQPTPVLQAEADAEAELELADIAGVLVLGLAGVVLVVGAMAALLARRL